MPTRFERGRRLSVTLAFVLLAALAGGALAPAAHATVFTWSNAAGGAWSNAANWSPAGVPATGDAIALPALGAAYVVTMDANPSISALSVGAGATLRLALNDSLKFTGKYIYNDGSIQVGSSVGTCLFLTDTTHFVGAGELWLSGGGRINNPLPRPQTRNWIFNEAGHTIRGGGQIWMPIHNYGLLHADGTSDNMAGARLQMCERLMNHASVRASHNGTFAMGGPYQSFGGQIVGQDGTFSTIVVQNSNAGFTIDNLNGGAFVADGGELFVAAGTITNGNIQKTGSVGAVHFNSLGNPSDIVVDPGAELILDGQYDWTVDGSRLENHGIVRVRGLLNIFCSTTGSCNLTGDGTTVLEGGTISMGALGGSLHNAAGSTISGCGTIAANVINDGTISLDCQTFMRDATLSNRGTFRLMPGANLFASGSTMQIVNSGTVSLGGTSYIDQGAGVFNYGGTFVSSGLTIFGYRGAGAKVVGGTLASTGTGRYASAGHVTLQGVTLAPGSTFQTILNATTRVSNASVLNQGTNIIDAGATFVVDAGVDYLQTGGATVLNSGTLTVPRGFLVGGALTGTGTVVGNVTNGGDVTPNIGATGLLVQGDYLQLPQGRLNIGLSGYTADQCAHLAVTGNAQLGGAVAVSGSGGFAPALGRNFTVMGTGTRAGEFSAVVPAPGMGPMVAYYNGSEVSLLAAAALGVGGPSLPATLRFYGHGRGYELALPQDAAVNVRAFDVAGRVVAVLADGLLTAGVHRLDLDATALPAGLYFARATVVSAGARASRTATTVLIR